MYLDYTSWYQIPQLVYISIIQTGRFIQIENINRKINQFFFDFIAASIFIFDFLWNFVGVKNDSKKLCYI